MIDIQIREGKRVAQVSELHNWENNPREIKPEDFERLQQQIKLGEYKPILVMPDGTVLGGNMRLKAFNKLGIKEVWVSVISFEQQPNDKWMAVVNGDHMPAKLYDNEEHGMLEYALSDNDRAGYYIEEKVQELLRLYPVDPHLYAIDLKPPTLLDLRDPASDVTEDEPPEVDNLNVVSKLGEIYQLGKHRLMCGDSTSVEQVSKLMNGNKSDMVFTDPPYLMCFTGNVHADGSKSFNAQHGEIMNDSMSKEDGDKFIYNIFEVISAFNKGAYYVCFYRLGLDYIFRALDKMQNKYKALIIWDKGNHTLSNSDYMSRYEPIVYGWFNEHKFYGTRSNFDIWQIDRTVRNDLHPTMKPVALVAHALENSSVTDDIVLDLFGGSGTTLIASEQLGRTCYMSELDPKYCDVIRKRYAKFIGKEEEWESITPPIITTNN